MGDGDADPQSADLSAGGGVELDSAADTGSGGNWSEPRVNELWPFAARAMLPVAISAPASLRTITGTLTAWVDTLFTATPVAVPAVLSNASK